jgi:hypothetical protein
MKLSTGKIVLGATLAISLGAFTLPAGASVPSDAQSKSTSKIVGVQYAQVTVEQKVDEKADEVKNEAVGAKDAVEAAHRKHEANEARPHTMTGKVDSKMDEGKNEVTGAANAVENAHEQHEVTEKSEGRD